MREKQKREKREGERKGGQIELDRGTGRVKVRETEKKSVKDRESKAREREKVKLKERDLHAARAIPQRLSPEIWQRFVNVLCYSMW